MATKAHILKDSVFESLLGPYDPSGEKWTTVTEYLEDMLTKEHPQSRMIEPKSGRDISYEHLFLTGQKVAAELKELFHSFHFKLIL